MKTQARVNDLMFGEKLSYSSKRKVDFQLSTDKKAFDLIFNKAVAAGVGAASFDGLKKTRSPIGIGTYSAVIPATGKDVKTSFVASGFVVSEPGTNSTVILTVNDQHNVAHFDANTGEQGFTLAVEYQAKEIKDIRLALILVAERGLTHPAASALIAVGSLSADAAIRGSSRRAG